MNVFDEKAKLAQRARAATAPTEIRAATDYLREEFGWRLFDRVCDIKRRFPLAVEFGCGRGHTGKHLAADMVDQLHQCDNCALILDQCEAPSDVATHRTLLKENDVFPFADNSVDLVMSNLSLHWINDLPSTFKGIARGLKPDGCFIGSIFCKDTLFELRCSLQMAELERDGGLSPHVSPLVDNLDIGSLLTGAGFTLLTVDVDELVVGYPSMFELLTDLRAMGENNCAWNRPLRLKRETLLSAAAIYSAMYGNEDGSVPATFQVLNFIGWKPDPSQPKPVARGSQQFSLKDLDKLDEFAQQKGLLSPDDVKPE